MFQFPLFRALSRRYLLGVLVDRIQPLHGNTKVAPGRVIGNRIIKML